MFSYTSEVELSGDQPQGRDTDASAASTQLSAILRLSSELHHAIGSYLRYESDFQCYRLTCKSLYSLLPPPGLRLPPLSCDTILRNRGFTDDHDYVIFLGRLKRDMEASPSQNSESANMRSIMANRKSKHYCLCQGCEQTWIIRVPRDRRNRECKRCQEAHKNRYKPGFCNNIKKQAWCKCGENCRNFKIVTHINYGRVFVEKIESNE